MTLHTPRLLGAFAIAALLAGPVVAQDATEIVVYNAQHESVGVAWAEAFTAETGIKVVLRNGGDTEFGNQIVAEGDASPADVFLTENSPAMALVSKAGLFAPVDADTLALVPESFRPATGDWTGIAARSTVFVYDTRKLSEADLPGSIMDLAKPEWKGRWAASPTGADFQAIVAAILDLEGEDATKAWLDGMKANSTAYRGNNAVLKAVNAGEVESGVIYHYYFYKDRAKTGENSDNTALHFFGHQDPGAFVSISGGGVLKSSKHPEAAQAFLRWIVGPGGQEILQTGDAMEYAVSGPSNPALPPLESLDAPAVNPADLDSTKVYGMMLAAGIL